MIDLIIPYYNNPKGLLETLNSINTNVFKITIVDDGSNNYLPPQLMAAQVFRYSFNKGPGYARQWGIDHTNNPYIMFIDTGDIFISKEIQEEIPKMIYKFNYVNMLVWPYIYKDEITKQSDNRMHGKLYKRSFIEKYHINFCNDSSYMNEDIGFNRACRIISKAIQEPIVFFDKPIIKWIENENSLTQKDNHAVLYRDQTRALSLTSIHTIELCKKNNIDVTEEINQISIALYYWFLRTVIERPEFIHEAWNGAKIFYKKYENDINPTTIMLGNPEIKKCLELRGKVNFPINILRFYHDIQQNNITPYGG